MKLGLALNTCEDYILIKWTRIVCFEGCNPTMYYDVTWTRKTLNDEWRHFRIYDRDAAWDNGSTTHRFNNAHLGIWYDFAIRMCNEDYGCSYPWSPTVTIWT